MLRYVQILLIYSDKVYEYVVSYKCISDLCDMIIGPIMYM